jgi:uncharacterized protein (DUF1697 family)
MPQYLAFLRGINLGNRRMEMAQLRTLFEELGFTNVATFIASGNVIFTSKTTDTPKLEKQIEAKLEKSLGYEVDTFVRTRTEVAAIAACNPFTRADRENPAHTIHTGFLHAALTPVQRGGLLACRTETDEFCVAGREFYWLCRIRSHESKVWASPSLRALKLPTSSMRNLTTVRKLAALYPPMDV